eukprot:TRINITY_DN50490_c0_g1_i1.p1 TRINITY_DN50490_c0_g1~~TRINITY_DN50490_c0_g1_i1.p1  ORF type:complete len:258 (-),score=33.49 TRINITY_DN50490_c0_g1_i1:26-799(-)
MNDNSVDFDEAVPSAENACSVSLLSGEILSIDLDGISCIKELRQVLADRLDCDPQSVLILVDDHELTQTDAVPLNVTAVVSPFRVGLVFDEATPTAVQTLALGDTGNVSHTISAAVTWPAAGDYPPYRSWILNLGQLGQGAHHWLWNPARRPYPQVAQLGVWSGRQSQRELPVVPSATSVITTTFEKESSRLVVYIDGKVHEEVEHVAFNFRMRDQKLHVCNFPGAESSFLGGVRDLRVWSRALSPNEVAEFCGSKP